MAYRRCQPHYSRNVVLDTPRTPLVVGTALAAATLITTVAVDDGPVLCPFRRCTGGYCPGCGGSRAARALVTGDLSAAWQLHPWVVLIAAQASVLFLVTALVQSGFTVQLQLRKLVTPVLAVNGVFGLGLWISRLAMGQIPIPFG